MINVGKYMSAFPVIWLGGYQAMLLMGGEMGRQVCHVDSSVCLVRSCYLAVIRSDTVQLFCSAPLSSGTKAFSHSFPIFRFSRIFVFSDLPLLSTT